MRLANVVVLFTLSLSACGGTSLKDSESPGSDTTVGPTWYRDVLPIVQKNCQGCHLEGGIAPFALDSWESAAAMHLSIAHAVSTRQMPPWMASDACMPLKHDSQSISGATRLTSGETSSCPLAIMARTRSQIGQLCEKLPCSRTFFCTIGSMR